MSKEHGARAESLLLEQLEQVDRICDEFEASWKAGKHAQIEDYLPSVPDEVSRHELVRSLVSLEVEYRVGEDEAPTLEEYERRFPGYSEDIRHAFDRLTERDSDPMRDSTHSDANQVSAETQSQTPAGSGLAKEPIDHPQQIGRHKVLKVLGQGGFGTVYLARDDELQRDVAIKMWRADRFSSVQNVDALIEEARNVARLDKHPNIVGVHDVGRREDGSVFVVLEYIAGHSLEQELKSNKPPADRIWEIMTQVCAAVGHAHASGLVHRDLKPANILLDDAGNAHVTDFGLAIDEETQHDKAGEISGTVPYMPPEQVRGETQRLDGRADIWALGVILYEMLTGRRPFHGEDRDELFDEILHREPKPPRQMDAEIPEGLEEVCLKGCSSPFSQDELLCDKDLG